MCLASRPSETIHSIASNKSGKSEISSKYKYLHGGFTLITKDDESEDTFPSSEEDKVLDEPFVYDPNNFTEDQFYQHVLEPGPQQRYYYFKQRNQSMYFDN